MIQQKAQSLTTIMGLYVYARRKFERTLTITANDGTVDVIETINVTIASVRCSDIECGDYNQPRYRVQLYIYRL